MKGLVNSSAYSAQTRRRIMKLEKKSDKKIEMSDKERKALLKAQQREMDDMALYTNLAAKAKNKTQKEMLKLMADEEGKHASILKTYTGETLKPKAFRSLSVLFLLKIIGMTRLAKLLSKDEIKASNRYEPYVEQFKKVKEIMADEKKHAERILKLCE